MLHLVPYSSRCKVSEGGVGCASLRGFRRGGATRRRAPINSKFIHLSLHFDRRLQYTGPPGGIPPSAAGSCVRRGNLDRSLGDAREGPPRTPGDSRGGVRQARHVRGYGPGDATGEHLGPRRVPRHSGVPIAVCTVIEPPSLPMHVALLRSPPEQALVYPWCCGSTSLQTAVEQRGWIAEADPDYGVFVLTPEGIDEATN